MDDIFREAALEQLSAQESLDQRVEVASSRAWIGLAIPLLLLAVALVAAARVEVPDYVAARGTLHAESAQPSDTPTRVVLYVTAAERIRIQPAMDVHVAPDGVDPSEYGYLRGQVARVAAVPASNASEGASPSGRDPRSGTRYAVHVVLETGDRSALRWTLPRERRPHVTEGTPCEGRIVVERQSVVDMLL